MCKWGTYETVEVTVCADLSATGKQRRKKIKVDACIADIVRALDAAGIKMRASCCGHSVVYGQIELQDGRCLAIQGPNNGIELRAEIAQVQSRIKRIVEILELALDIECDMDKERGGDE